MKVKHILVGGIGALLASQSAYAQVYYDDPDLEDVRPDMYSYAWSDPTLMSEIGIGFHIGGGIAGFTDSDAMDVVDSDVGGLWQARAAIGTHIPLGVELAYIGTAVDMASSFDGDTGTLIGTAFEASLRWNVLPHYSWNPYLFLGAGWQHYDVTDASFSRAVNGVADEDDLAIFPMGVGFQYRDMSGLVYDVRGTFRAAEESSLIADASEGNADLHTWEASGSLGYEF